jgi:hypothetical protein
MGQTLGAGSARCTTFVYGQNGHLGKPRLGEHGEQRADDCSSLADLTSS